MSRKHVFKYLFLLLALCFISTSQAYATNITDIDNLDVILFEENAEALYKVGLFSGTNSAKYVPELESMADRQQAIKMIAVALDWEIDPLAKSEFNDVSDWAHPYVAKAAELGVVNGIGNNNFGSRNPITGQQLCAILLRTIGYNATQSWDEAGVYASRELNLSVHSILDKNLNRDRLVGILYYFLTNAEPITKDYTYMENIVSNHPNLLPIAKEARLVAPTFEVSHINGSLKKDLTDIFTLKNDLLAPDVIQFVEKLIIDKVGQPQAITATFNGEYGQEYEALDVFKADTKNYTSFNYTTRFGGIKISGSTNAFVLDSIYIDEKDYFSIYGLNIGDYVTDAQIKAIGFEDGWYSYDTITHNKSLPEFKRDLYMSFEFTDKGYKLVSFSIEASPEN